MKKKSLKNIEISEVLEKGKFIQGQLINLYYLPFSEEKTAFLVTKRIKGAVKRNRVKRHIREAWRLRSEHLKKKAGVCIVAKQSAEKAKFNNLSKELNLLIKKTYDNNFF